MTKVQEVRQKKSDENGVFWHMILTMRSWSLPWCLSSGSTRFGGLILKTPKLNVWQGILHLCYMGSASPTVWLTWKTKKCVQGVKEKQKQREIVELQSNNVVAN